MMQAEQERDLLPKVKRSAVNLRQQVLGVLRRAILEFHFKPGDRLIERELCEMTGVSRTSVREALRHLESEGLVQSLPNKGPTVARVTVEEAQALYEVREALEGLACRLFVERASRLQVERLQAALGQLGAAIATHDVRLIVGETTNFYDVLLEGCGNPIVHETIRSLQARVVFLRGTSMSQPGRSPGSFQEMCDIVTAIVSHDPESAEVAARLHVRRAREAAISVLQQQLSGETAEASNGQKRKARDKA